MAGGRLPHATTVTEQHLLDLEREAFLSSARGAEDARADSAHVEDREAAEELRARSRNHRSTRIRRAGRARSRHSGPVGVDEARVDALAARCRVITFSLAMSRPAARPSTIAGLRLLRAADRRRVDALGLPSAIVCGVSYGGLIAATFAARHPDRTARRGRRRPFHHRGSLMLASAS